MNRFSPITLFLVLALTTAACGTSETVEVAGNADGASDQGSDEPQGASCNGVEALRFGLPTFDYDRSETLEDLVASVDVVLVGTLDSAIWTPLEGADPGEGTIVITLGDYGPMTPASPDVPVGARFEIGAVGDDGEPHPLVDPIEFPAPTQFIAFADLDPNDSSLLHLHPQGLHLRCENAGATSDSVETILESLPADAPALDFFGLVDTVTAVAPAKPPRPAGDITEIPHRVLADGLDTGQPWSTQVITEPEVLAALAPDLGPVDFDAEVVFALNPAESGSCPFGPVEGLSFDKGNRVLFPVVPLAEDFEACTGDANAHLIVVAVAKADLPEAPFDVWVNGAEPPSGVVDGVSTYVGDE